MAGDMVAPTKVKTVIVMLVWQIGWGALLGQSNSKKAEPYGTGQIETELLLLVNQARIAQNLQPLRLDSTLQKIARDFSEKMAREGRLSHYFPDRCWPEAILSENGRFFSVLAENIARSESFNPDFIHESFINSILHRINIFNPRLTHAGIGVVKWGLEYYVTQEFAAFIEPMPIEVAINQIENDLFTWYRQRFAVALLIHADARLTARVYSQQYRLGIPVFFFKAGWKRSKVINLSFISLEVILSEIKKEIEQSRYQSFAVGVTWGRSIYYPGGAYFVSVMFFE